MNGFDSTTALWLLVAAQCFGVFSAAAARLSEGSPCQAISQWVFLVALPLVGAATVRCPDGRAGGLGSLRRFARGHGADRHLRPTSKAQTAVW